MYVKFMFLLMFIMWDDDPPMTTCREKPWTSADTRPKLNLRYFGHVSWSNFSALGFLAILVPEISGLYKKKYMVGTTVGHEMRCNILGEDGDQPFMMGVLSANAGKKSRRDHVQARLPSAGFEELPRRCKACVEWFWAASSAWATYWLSTWKQLKEPRRRRSSQRSWRTWMECSHRWLMFHFFQGTRWAQLPSSKLTEMQTLCPPWQDVYSGCATKDSDGRWQAGAGFGSFLLEAPPNWENSLFCFLIRACSSLSCSGLQGCQPIRAPTILYNSLFFLYSFWQIIVLNPYKQTHICCR